MASLLLRVREALADRYRVEEELGRGGMSIVFLATDLKHGRPVALKVLLPEVSISLGAERFDREIRIAAGLVHGSILPLHDSGEAGGLLYHVTPYVEGESLRDRLHREPQLPVSEAVRITCELADGLDYAHGKGIVHRDVKPENVLLSKGHALIADFGVARAISVVGGERLTETGIVLGTPAYMSPEQATGEPSIDGRSDQYALACMTYEMLGGETPLSGRTPQVIMARRLSETPGSLCVIRETVPPAMDQVIRKALSRLPADRFPTTREYAQALASAESGAVVFAPAPPPAPPRKLSFWEELKARRVYNVGFVYLATAWIVVESSGVVLDSFNVAGAHRYVILAAAAGFPIALALAWLFEFSRSGIRRTQAIDLRKTEGRRLRKLPVISRRAVLVVVAMLALFGLWRLVRWLL